MSEVTSELVERIAELAHLEFPGEELSEFTTDFAEILDYFQQLQEVSTSQVEPLYQALRMDSLAPPLRSDRIEPSLPADGVLEQAPASDGEHFRVPKVID